MPLDDSLRAPALAWACALLVACSGGGGDGDADVEADAEPDADGPVCDAEACDSGCREAGSARGECDETGACACSGDPGGPWVPTHGTSALPVSWEDDCLDDAPAELLEGLLDAAGVDLARLGLTEEDLAGADYLSVLDDPALLPWFTEVQRHPMRVPCFASSIVEALDSGVDDGAPASTAIAVSASLLGMPVRPLEAVPAAADVEQPLAEAVATFVRVAGEEPDEEALARAAEAVPAEVQAAIAPLLRAMGPVVEARRAWVEAYDVAYPIVLFAQALATPLPLGGGLDVTDPEVLAFLLAPERAALFQAAYDLAVTVESLDHTRLAGREASFQVETPLGTVAIAGPGDDVHDEEGLGEPVALLVDLGGDDVYRAAVGATGTDVVPVSVLVDLGGRDFYGYTEVRDPDDAPHLLPSDASNARASAGAIYGAFSLSSVPRQGAGVLGVGLLFDLGEEDDVYRSLRASQGAGLAGVGALVDEGGSDRYEAEASSQGAAYFGIGALVDLGDGDDERSTYHEGQGFGYVGAVGVLWDGGGGDRYLADVGDPALGGHPVYYSPQRPGTGNSSFTGGAGFGRRGDEDRVFLSGGVGLLRDRGEGADTYTTSVFGLATGYWQGTGLLVDDGGDDDYDGLWYVLGGAAHYALAALFDRGGDDTYGGLGGVVGVNMGSGHDFSVGLLWDGAGDDHYLSSSLGLGTGNCNGVGLFVDGTGRDVYEATSSGCCGLARTSSECDVRAGRQRAVTMGFFVDGGGVDDYSGVPDGEGREGTVHREDDSLWLFTGLSDYEVTEHGGGVDGEDGAGLTLP